MLEPVSVGIDSDVPRRYEVFLVSKARCPRCNGILRQLRKSWWPFGPGLVRCHCSPKGAGTCNQPMLIFSLGDTCIVGFLTPNEFHALRPLIESGEPRKPSFWLKVLGFLPDE